MLYLGFNLIRKNKNKAAKNQFNAALDFLV